VRLPIGVALFAGALAGGHLPDSLSGEILDSKCWFGAMQPSDSKVHKAGAPLCVRGDVPPAFFARGPAGQGALMIMTAAGRAHGPELLGLVADPVRLTGRVFRHGDHLMLGALPAAIRRLQRFAHAPRALEGIATKATGDSHGSCGPAPRAAA